MAREPPPCSNCNPDPPSPLGPLYPYLAPTLSFLTALALYRLYLRNRRIPTAADLPTSYLRSRTLHGRIVAVNDPDNIHLFHTPLRFFNSIPKSTRNATIHVRIAGVDAPELAHFGSPEQPYAREALGWTRAKALGRQARVSVYSKDQYGRVVGRVEVKRGWLGVGLWCDLGGWMLREGWATVYDAKTGAEFGGRERRYRNAEEWARRWKKGMWREGAAGVVRPGEFKAAEKAKGNGGVGAGVKGKAGKGKVVVVGKAAGRKGLVTPAAKATAVKGAAREKRKKQAEDEHTGYTAWIWSLITGKRKT